jgi:thiamine biosynthesis lipoprotein
MKGIYLFLFFNLSLFTTFSQEQLFSFSQIKMGTEFYIKVYSTDSAKTAEIVNQAWTRIDEINQLFSDYIQTSELTRIHNHKGKPIKISDEFASLLRLSLKYSKASGGAFDVSIGALSRLWRRSIKMNEFPTQEKIVMALTNIGFKKIKLQGTTLTLPDGILFDFGAIAKGYAVDEAYKVLSNKDLKKSIVDGGGDIYAGESTDTMGWKIAIKVKNENQWRDSVVYVKNKGIATSGDQYKYIEDDHGNRYAHIINPKTGYGVKGPLLTTVVAENATHADALATTLSVLNRKEEKKFKRKIKISYSML